MTLLPAPRFAVGGVPDDLHLDVVAMSLAIMAVLVNIGV